MNYYTDDDIDEIIKDIGVPSTDLSLKLQDKLKYIYDSSVSSSKKSYGGFDSLIVDDLDPDSIWEEIKSRNEPLTNYIFEKLNGLLEKQKSIPESSNNHNHHVHDKDESNNNNNNNNDDDNHDDDYEQELKDNDYDDNDNDEEENQEGKYSQEIVSEDQKPLTEDEEDEMEEYLDELEREESNYQEKLARKERTGKGHKDILEVLHPFNISTSLVTFIYLFIV
jgi:hypothetical protein